MRGEILSFDEGSGIGLISGDDGIRYSFDRSAVQPPAAIRSGLRVDFVPENGEAVQVMLLTGAAPASGDASLAAAPPASGFDFAKAMFSFNGRLRRSHFWIAWSILFVVGLLLNLIPLVGPISIVLLWPHLAIGAKRFHDMGKSGWLIAIPYVVMICGWIYAVAAIGFSAISNPSAIEDGDPAAIMALLGPAMGALSLTWLVGLAFWLWLGVADSQPGANKYGPYPKGL